MVRQSLLKGFAAIVFWAVAGFLLHLPSELGVSLAIPPDSQEYSIGLANLFGHGIFGFTLNGEWYPSRYLPWFSLLCLSPAYYLSGGNVLSLHLAILAFALVFLVFSCKLGRAAGLGKWSFVCAIVPMFVPDFVFYSRMVMTEIPYLALFAASALVFVRFAEATMPSFLFCFGAGALVAWSGTARATGLPMLALFATALLFKKFGWKRKAVSVILLSFPAIAYELAGLLYNRCVFGSPFRSGYHYWVSVPMDFPDLAFNLGYVAANAKLYLREPVVQMMLAFAAVVAVVAVLTITGRFGGVRRNRRFLLLSGYVFFQYVILSVLYAGYYFFDVRFFLPVALCLIPLFLASAAMPLADGKSKYTGPVVIVLASLCMVGFSTAQPQYSFMVRGYPIWIVEAEMTGAVMPEGSVVMQDGNPAIIDFFGSGLKGLGHFPLNRDFDYVRQMVAPTSLANIVPKPNSVSQSIIPDLVASGVCRLPFPETFEENPEKIKTFLNEGRRVFLHRGVSCKPNSEESRKLFEVLDAQGLEAKEFGVWAVPAIAANPVRRIYDSFVFPRFSMDSRPEVKSVYYEISLKRR